MANSTSGVGRQAQHAARLDWLRARPALLARLPSTRDDVDDARSAALDEALRAMLLVRLYAPTSRASASRDGIRRLVSELRGLPVPPDAQTWRHRGVP